LSVAEHEAHRQRLSGLYLSNHFAAAVQCGVRFGGIPAALELSAGTLMLPAI
jgi:hypothetical protein